MSVETAAKPELKNDFRLHVLISARSLAPAAALVFWLVRQDATELFAGLTRWWAPWLLLATSITAITALLALWSGYFSLERVAAVFQVALILAGWAFAQFPALIVSDVSIYTAAAPDITLRFLLIALGAGAIILFPALGDLFLTFKQGDFRLDGPH